MVTQELSDYISKARAQGMSDEQILANLTKEGWREADVKEGLQGSTIPSAPGGYPLRLLGAVELLQAAWERFKSRWKTAVAVQLLPSLILIIPGLIIGLSMFGASRMEEGAVRSMAMGGGVLGFILLFIPLMLVFAVLTYWAQIAQYRVLGGAGVKSWKEAYGVSKGLIWPYFVLSFALSFVTLAGFALLVVPGIILSIMAFAAYPVLVQENMRGFDALAKSRWYADGLKMELFKRFALLFLIGIGFGIVFSIFSAIPVLGNIASLMFQVVFTPFMVAFSLVLYENVKALKGNATYTPTESGKRFFLYWFIGGLLVIPLTIIAFAVAIIPAFNNYIYDEKQGDFYEEGFEQYLPEDYEQQLENSDLMQEEQMRELERMMQEYGMSPLPRNQDGTDPNELI